MPELQEVLGRINDIAVANARLGAAGGDRGGEEGARAAGVIAGWHAGRRKRLLAAADKAWARYRAAKRFRRPG